MAIASINPATSQKLKEFSAFTESEIEKRLQRAERAFHHHRREPFPKRAQLLMAAASLLEHEKKEFARTITLEMGKLFGAAVEDGDQIGAGGAASHPESRRRSCSPIRRAPASKSSPTTPSPRMTTPIPASCRASSATSPFTRPTSQRR